MNGRIRSLGSLGLVLLLLTGPARAGSPADDSVEAQTVESLLDEAARRAAAREYDAAMKLVEAAAELDPDSQAAAGAKRMLAAVIRGLPPELTEADTTELRVYDIRQVLSQPTPRLPDDDDDPPSRNERVHQLVLLIQDSIGDPDDWLVGHYTIGQMNGRLVVRASPKAHGEIAWLLAELGAPRPSDAEPTDGNAGQTRSRERDSAASPNMTMNTQLPDARDGQSSQIQIETRMLIVSDTWLDRFQIDWNQKTASRVQTSVPVDVRPFALLDHSKVTLLVHAVQADPSVLHVVMPRITTFSGHRADIDDVRLIRPNPDATLSPHLKPLAGVTVIVQPTLTANRQVVSLRLRPQIDLFPSAGRDGTADRTDQPEQAEVWRRNLRLNVKEGSTVLIDMGELPHGAHLAGFSEDTATTQSRRVLLLVREMVRQPGETSHLSRLRGG